MLRKILGACSGFLAIGSAMFAAMAISDLVAGKPETGVLIGLLVFFGGMTAATGYGAVRLMRAVAPAATTAPPAAPLAGADAAPSGPDIDIALEARLLAHAAQHAGRVTAAEIAVACAVPIDAATAALDGLAARGHADLQVSADGAAVYVIAGFLSKEQKERAEAVLERSWP